MIIAAAGGAAHLAGVVASHTTLPVIGMPVPTELSGGLDSLLSTVQMPGDVPVATVGVGGGGPRNAGLLAVEILALGNVGLQEKLAAFKHQLAEKVGAKDEKLQRPCAARSDLLLLVPAGSPSPFFPLHQDNLALASRLRLTPASAASTASRR